MDEKVTCEEKEDREEKKGPSYGGDTLYDEFHSTSGLLFSLSGTQEQ
jgi:hypothetical protein